MIDETSNEGENSTLIKLLITLQPLLWIIFPPLYVIGVLYRKISRLKKMLQIFSIIFSPMTWIIFGAGRLFMSIYADGKDQEKRIVMFETCSSTQLVPMQGTIECVPYENVTQWSDKIGTADAISLQNILNQDSIDSTQIISKHVEIKKIEKEDYEKQVQTVAYVVEGLSNFPEQEPTLEPTTPHEWSQAEEYSWNIGQIHQKLPLSSDTWSVVLNEFRVRWPEAPLLFAIKGTTVHPKDTSSSGVFNNVQWSGGIDSWEGITYDNYNLAEREDSLVFHTHTKDIVPIHTKHGWVQVIQNDMYIRDDNIILSSILILHDADSELTFVQMIE